MDVFWQKGYDGASCEDLLEAMKINCGSMYAAFGDKRALFDRAFDLYAETVFAKGMAILDGPGTPLENVRSLIERWAESASNPERKGCLVTNTLIEFGKEPSATERARALLDRVRDEFQRKLQLAQERGELRSSADPKELADFLINTAQGLSVMARSGADKQTIRGVVKTALCLLA
ncbi:HTH-type transcriptional repressor ComR [Planctomycetes bacterium Pan216]|uniref:HTH-type transcriptional repressor ComR n=2 Tax=Kolteria novifilia TaxID=2527975 RepID=A0A518B8V4_9BACT|nr:HTH-type transcriptional repressor ComR [Planctomycetes bacterium Pan216]